MGVSVIEGFPQWLIGKEFACIGVVTEDCGFGPWVGKIPWSRAWQPTPVFLPGESHGQRSLVGYSPWGHKELDMTEFTHTHTHTHNVIEHCCVHPLVCGWLALMVTCLTCL